MACDGMIAPFYRRTFFTLVWLYCDLGTSIPSLMGLELMLYHQTQAKLAQITAELHSLELWALTPPSAEAMESRAPFACDLMPLEQWLQFTFIPRMQALIDAAQPLPTKIAITPMAQHVWATNTAMQPLIGILNELDMLLNESR